MTAEGRRRRPSRSGKAAVCSSPPAADRAAAAPADSVEVHRNPDAGVETRGRADRRQIDARGGVEGEIILGRYQILKIGNESIEMAYPDGRGRQTIRLTGQ